jgi:hypothetical protein
MESRSLSPEIRTESILPKILSEKKEEKNGMLVIERIVQDEVLGRVVQRLIVAKDQAVHRSWSGRLYSEVSMRRIKVKDGRDAIDIIWGSEGEGRSDWYWVIIVPPDPQQIERLFEAVRDYDAFKNVFAKLYDACISKNVNKRVECDLSAIFINREAVNQT